eukprot:maker-scaffold_16-snap-gene-2.52-mRNA-1 protein AED:0.38 eAED:0.38 QI:0/0.5/0.33/1/0/0/3/249/66
MSTSFIVTAGPLVGFEEKTFQGGSITRTSYSSQHSIKKLRIFQMLATKLSSLQHISKRLFTAVSFT